MLLLGDTRTQRRPSHGPIAINRGSSQALGLLGWWPLAMSGDGSDYSGKGYHLLGGAGVSYGTPAWTGTSSTEGGLAPTFVSGSSTVLYYTPAAAGALPMTLAVWFYSDTDLGDEVLLRFGPNTRHDRSLQIEFGATYLRLLQRSNTFNFLASRPTTGALYHAVAVVNGLQDRKLYLNGVKVVDDTTTLASSVSQQIISIGASYYPGAIASPLDGRVLDARIYTRGLNDSEVWALYSPRTRWDLYWTPSRRVYLDVAAAAAGVPKQMDNILRSTWA